jgi:hypothetical protein
MSSTAVQGQIDRSIHRRTSCGCRAALPCAPATLPLPNGHKHGGSDQPGKSGWPYGSSSPSPFYWPLQPEVWCSPQGSRSGGAPSPSSLYSAAAPRHLRGLVFFEAAVVTIGGLAGGALVAWGLSVMLVELLTGVFDPAPSVIAVSVGYVGVAVLAVVAALMAAALASAHTSTRPAVEELREL